MSKLKKESEKNNDIRRLIKIYSKMKNSKKMNKNDHGLKKFDNSIKRSKPEIVKPDKSLRSYMKQKWKRIYILFVFYAIIFGAVLSTPILVNHFRVINRNETDQERSITYKFFKEITPE